MISNLSFRSLYFHISHFQSKNWLRMPFVKSKLILVKSRFVISSRFKFKKFHARLLLSKMLVIVLHRFNFNRLAFSEENSLRIIKQPKLS